MLSGHSAGVHQFILSMPFDIFCGMALPQFLGTTGGFGT